MELVERHRLHKLMLPLHLKTQRGSEVCIRWRGSSLSNTVSSKMKLSLRPFTQQVLGSHQEATIITKLTEHAVDVFPRLCLFSFQLTLLYGSCIQTTRAAFIWCLAFSNDTAYSFKAECLDHFFYLQDGHAAFYLRNIPSALNNGRTLWTVFWIAGACWTESYLFGSLSSLTSYLSNPWEYLYIISASFREHSNTSSNKEKVHGRIWTLTFWSGDLTEDTYSTSIFPIGAGLTGIFLTSVCLCVSTILSLLLSHCPLPAMVTLSFRRITDRMSLSSSYSSCSSPLHPSSSPPTHRQR